MSMYSRELSAIRPGTYQTQGSGAPLVSQQSIISERVVEHEIKVPKKVVREEIVEKVVVVPEKVVVEEVVEETQTVQERIVEVARPVVTEKYVEVPKIEYREKIVHVPEVIVQEVIKKVPRHEVREKVVEVPRTVYRDKIVEIPDIEYVEVPVEKVVEVPNYIEKVEYREVTVPQYVEKPVPHYVDVEVPQDIDRNVPIPLEATTTYEFLLPKLKAKPTRVEIPIYAPRFVEVPVPQELMSAQDIAAAENLSRQINSLAQRQAPSLCEIEELVKTAQLANFNQCINQDNLQSNIQSAWRDGRLHITPSPHY
ncbi:inner membrane complex protein [Gregarina niphandrodes]|uniref:Inner membrane complex protein n=1 Tax=Gregarina niphandrodes TaxID=110365 RepID=A0A023BBN9_GRENI|nr:inner membrane complex protein [Gregarina niphandrodes]EZG79610.1 inner membrane complex protein [Gregarina niphandrodes]|eukprot:XP_011134406.1 inner membrane complex protein [Gregarina niphandrodes]